jgi:hypothetical protein
MKTKQFDKIFAITSSVFRIVSLCLLYGARDEKHNDAVALKELLDFKLGMRLKH